MGAGRGWKGDADSPPAISPTSAAMGSLGYRTHSHTKGPHIIRQFPDEEAEPSYQRPNWPAGYCRRPLPLPRRATAAPGAGRLLSAPASARIATRLAGPRVGAFWKPGDPALISSPGQPDTAHGRPALVDRQNPVLTTGPVCRRRVPGRSRKMLSPFGGDRGFESFSLQQRVHELSVPERDIGLAALLAMTCLAVSA